MTKKTTKMLGRLNERLPLVCARCNIYIASSPCVKCGSEYVRREGA